MPDTYRIRFFNGKEQEIKDENIFDASSESFEIPIKVGDYVMAVVLNEYKEKSYVPGVIEAIDTRSFPSLYSVKYFNGVYGGNKRNELVLISKAKFNNVTDYVRRKLRKE